MIPKHLWRVVLTGLLLGFLSLHGRASHIFGGDFSMSPLSTPGHYLLSLNLYADANAITDQHRDGNTVEVFMFSKKNFSKKSSIQLFFQSENSLIYGNKKCAQINNLKTIELKYSREIYLQPDLYSDLEGYYVIYERCCRTSNIDNLANRGQDVGMTYRLDFPCPYPNGKFVKNGAPDFGFPNGKLICINKPFEMSMSATDTDGDELRYSLVTPLQGYSTPAMLYGDGTSHDVYPEVRWAAGYSASNAIPGNPSLAINPKSGLLTVTANRLGVYIFTVLVEEYRNGTKIGSVRRDFQLSVVECSDTPPPMPIVEASSNPNQPASVVQLCEGNSVELSFSNTQPDVSYQWERNLTEISNATTNKLTVTQLGNYQVRASFTKACAPDTLSKLIKIVAGNAPPNTIVAKDSLPICQGDSTRLNATNSTDYQYEWRKDGTIIPNANRATITVREHGTYTITLKSPNFGCANIDTLIVRVRAPINKPIILSNQPFLCENDSVQLRVALPAGTKAQWLPPGNVIKSISSDFYAKQSGSYQVRVYEGSCSALSDSISVIKASPALITFDSLRAVCYSDTARILLKATPLDGKFSGDGLSGNVISVKNAGVGRHAINYELVGSPTCRISKTRYLDVKPLPSLRAPARVTQVLGAETTLNVQSETPIGERYQWTPPDGISNPNILQPSVSATQNTTYTLLATSPDGCTSTISMNVMVVELIFVPDAFTPNGDGLNDTWEIQNLERFPEAELFVYNRWGELVHHQSKDKKTPWDGNYLDKPAPIGEYSYVILPNTSTDTTIRRGKVALLR